MEFADYMALRQFLDAFKMEDNDYLLTTWNTKQVYWAPDSYCHCVQNLMSLMM